ncbi:hypothetical protein EV401DRAFT_585359 [Pisolithus croceorrhizus]|nr:hypothetical protein EV401DRAFT_585359 [Pisolithus croceorrhizus]
MTTCADGEHRQNIYLKGISIKLVLQNEGILTLFLPTWNHLCSVSPISEHQDTVGPLTRSVTDATVVLSIIAGPDPNDDYTLAQPSPVPDYTLALNTSSLVGKRLCVPRTVSLSDGKTGNNP